VTTSSQTLRQQGSPILLLADLHRRFPQLPIAELRISSVFPTQLEICVYRDIRNGFEAWRTALGLPSPTAGRGPRPESLSSAGVVADVPVTLLAYGTADDVAAMLELAEAVALLGALPMPSGAPLPGELAEQRHLIDPLDHALEHLADGRPAVQA
jgi:hypothetical protein